MTYICGRLCLNYQSFSANVNQYVSVLVEFLKAGSLPLQRETLCTLHYLALDQDHVNILLEEGVYDIATKLGSHSDIKIKRSCKSILQLLSQTVLQTFLRVVVAVLVVVVVLLKHILSCFYSSLAPGVIAQSRDS